MAGAFARFSRTMTPQGITAPDPSTVMISLTSPDSLLPYAFTNPETVIVKDGQESFDVSAARQFGSSANAQLIRLPDITSLVVVMDTTQAPFTDNPVRQAFKLAVDRQAVLNTVFAGFGVVTSDLMMAPTDLYYPDDLEQVSYDPDRAKSLLAAAGYSGGVDLDMWAYRTYSPLAVAYADTAKAAGIRANVRQGNPDTYWDTIYLHDRFYATDWQQYFPGDLVWYTFGSGSVANESKLNSPEIDELYNKALRTTGTGQQKGFIKQALSLAAKNTGLIIPVMADALLLAKQKVQGSTNAPATRYDLRHAYLSA